MSIANSAVSSKPAKESRSNASPVAVARSLDAMIRKFAFEPGEASSMPAPIVEALDRSGLFSVIVPTEFGGGGHDACTYLEVVEALSASDPSVGWSYMANSCENAIYAGLLGDDAVKTVFGGEETVIIAGMVAPMGTARTAPGGYMIGGKHSFGSGSAHANWIGGGALLQTDEGPKSLIYLVPREKVEFLGNWDVLGLQNTGSYDYRIAETFVPEGFAFNWDAAPSRGNASVRLGLALATIGHAGVALGTARRALEEIAIVVQTGRQRANPFGAVPPVRDQPHFLHEFAVADGAYRAARAYNLEAIATAVAEIEAKGAVSNIALARVRQAAILAVRAASDTVRTCFEWSGSVGLRNPSVLGLLFRDMATQMNHIVVEPNSLIHTAADLLDEYSPRD